VAAEDEELEDGEDRFAFFSIMSCRNEERVRE
jgi:hypothetical protein